jgi:hypothetical protein
MRRQLIEKCGIVVGIALIVAFVAPSSAMGRMSWGY